MDTVKELLEPVKARLNNSIIGSFTISWCVVNWKFLYVLVVSNIYSTGRVELAEMQLNHWISFPLPIIMTVFYVFLLPRIENEVTKVNKYVVLEKEKSIITHETSVAVEKTKLAKENVKLELAKADLKEAEEFVEKSRIYESTIGMQKKEIDDLKVYIDQDAIIIDDLKTQLNGLNKNLSALENKYSGITKDVENILAGNSLQKDPGDEKYIIPFENFRSYIQSLDDDERKVVSEILAKGILEDNKNIFTNILESKSLKNRNEEK